MKIHKLTFTGADNFTPISRMVGLCRKYPFVEFGILTKRQFWGDHDNHIIEFEKERYPSIKWIRELVGRFTIEGMRNNLSLHICPPLTYEIFNDFDILTHFDGFGRVQLNSAPSMFKLDIEDNKIYNTTIAMQRNIIIQLNGDEPESFYKNNMFAANKFGREYPAICGLFDGSGGRGQLPSQWRKPIYDVSELLIGYAGGLNPDNLEEEIGKIKIVSSNSDIWLDMESGVRTDRNFDLEKVEKCCEIVLNKGQEI